MKHQVNWNEEVYLEFTRLAMLNDLEREILRTRIMGYSITQQALLFNVSVATVNRIVARLKTKYDQVQELSDKLPKRKGSKEESWMDSH